MIPRRIFASNQDLSQKNTQLLLFTFLAARRTSNYRLASILPFVPFTPHGRPFSIIPHYGSGIHTYARKVLLPDARGERCTVYRAAFVRGTSMIQNDRP